MAWNMSELAKKLEAFLRATIGLSVLLMALAAVSLAAYIVVMVCWKCGALLANTVFNGRW